MAMSELKDGVALPRSQRLTALLLTRRPVLTASRRAN